MPTFQDSAFIFFLALLLFGPKKLPELARYVGKLMAEFRRASNEFRTQMEDELRVADQAEQQKKIAALEAAAPPVIAQDIPEPEHPHLDPVLAPLPENHIDARANGALPEVPIGEVGPEPVPSSQPAPLPIASQGDLHLMPPATGLPVSRSAQPNSQPTTQSSSQPTSLSGVFDSIPQAPDPAAAHEPEPIAHV